MKTLSWVESAFENLLSICALSSSSVSVHKAIRDLRISRGYENQQKMQERVTDVLEKASRSGEEETSLNRASSSIRAPDELQREDVLKCTACVLVVSELVAKVCIVQMSRLDSLCESWKWLSVRHRRVTVASYFMPGETVDQLFLTCDQKQAEAMEKHACLSAVLGRLRRGIFALEASSDVQQLHVAVKRHLVILQGILHSADLPALVETVKNAGPPPRTPSRASFLGLIRKAVDETISETRDVIDGMASCLLLISSASKNVGLPPTMLRRWPEVFFLGFSTVVALVTVRPSSMYSAAMSVASSAYTAWKSILQEHLEEPMMEIYKELFVKHDGVGLWAAQAQSSRASLERMIDTFNAHAAANSTFFPYSWATSSGPGPPGKGLDVVVRVYEEQMSRPVTNMLFGDMLQALLIQMQSLKANMEEEAAEVHALMKANQISLQCMAAVPAITFFAGCVYLVRRVGLWVMSEPAHPRNRLSLLLRATERLLAESTSKHFNLVELTASQQFHEPGDDDDDAEASKVDVQWGHLCFFVEQMRACVRFIYISAESRRELTRDLDLLLSLRPTIDSKISLLDSLRRTLPYLN